jgi:hypothetical protein
MHRVANYDADHPKTPRQPGQGTQILAGAAFALQRQNRLGCQAQFVGHSHPNAAVAYVEAEIAGPGFQCFAP